MATVIGVRFKKAGKVYYFDPDSVWPNPGDYVVVETARGIEIGETVTGGREISDDQIVAPLKKVIRIATDEDTKQAEDAAELERKAFGICQDKIAEHKLEMKLVEVEYTFDNSKIIFYFTANNRIDFRDLVKDLASIFKTRIELRQIGVRDEAKMLGGLGQCGRPICCGAFLSDFQPVSIKMAKEQNLSLNPTKISGQCGRLMCCLKYEQSFYESTLKRLPRVGKEVVTPDGSGNIIDINVLKETVKVKVRMPDDTLDVREYSIDDVKRPGQRDAEPGKEPAAPPEEKSGGGKRRESEDRPRERPREQARQDAAPSNGAGGKEAAPKPERRRYPKNKGPKKSTDQYFEKEKKPPREIESADSMASAEDLVVDESDDTI